MANFSIKDFLTENKLTEVSKVTELGKRLQEVKGSETQEGKHILNYFKTNLGMGDDGFKYMKNNLDNANPDRLRSVYELVKRWEKNNYNVSPQDAAIVNNTLEG